MNVVNNIKDIKCTLIRLVAKLMKILTVGRLMEHDDRKGMLKVLFTLFFLSYKNNKDMKV